MRTHASSRRHPLPWLLLCLALVVTFTTTACSKKQGRAKHPAPAHVKKQPHEHPAAGKKQPPPHETNKHPSSSAQDPSNKPPHETTPKKPDAGPQERADAEASDAGAPVEVFTP